MAKPPSIGHLAVPSAQTAKMRRIYNDQSMQLHSDQRSVIRPQASELQMLVARCNSLGLGLTESWNNRGIADEELDIYETDILGID